MEAGRELDMAIAVKVFGLRREESMYGSPWFVDDANPGWPTAMDDLPRYSTNLSAAWQIVDMFDSFDLDKNPQRNAHFGVEAGDRLWSCSLTRYTPELFGEGEASTASLAICRAALAVVGNLMEPER